MEIKKYWEIFSGVLAGTSILGYIVKKFFPDNWLEEKRLNKINRKISFNEIKKRIRIVVIDDDENSFPLKVLKMEGYAIDHWKSIEQGHLRILEEGEFDIIILDIGGVAKNLSFEDGYGVLEHLKKYNPSQVIVAFSGQTFDLGKSSFWKLADDTLTKPTDALKCKNVIDHLITEKFTIENYLKIIKEILRKGNIPEKKIKKIERIIVKEIYKGHALENQTIIDQISEYGDIADKVLKINESLTKLFLSP